MTDKFRRALSFAAKAHSTQLRKGSDTPYIVHPVEVSFLLNEAGADEEVMIAGLLHDTCEDTGVKPEEIESNFGKRVKDLVLSNTEDKTLSWEKRKQHTIDFLANSATYEEKLLICADKLANARSMLLDYQRIGDNLWNRFKRGYESQKWYYTGIVNSLQNLEGNNIYEELCKTVNVLFN